MVEHVGPHFFNHVTVIDFELCKFAHDAFVLQGLFCFKFWNPVLRKKLNQVLVDFDVVDYVFLHLKSIYFVQALVVGFGYCITRLEQLLN